ncbi:MAG: hypothetical protein AB1420_17390 [Bacillota bacterium]
MAFGYIGKMRTIRWLSVLLYPVAFIKGIVVGRMLGNLRKR